MTSIPLRPEYRPTLWQLLGPRWAGASRTARALVWLGALALVGAIVALVLHLLPTQYESNGPVRFSLHYRGIARVAPDVGGYIELRSPARGPLRSSLSVERLDLAAYSGGVNGAEPLLAYYYIRQRSQQLRGFELYGEGKTRVSMTPAYEVMYTAQVDGRLVYGRDILLPAPGEHPLHGVAIVLLARPSGRVGSPMVVGGSGALASALKSFSFG